MLTKADKKFLKDTFSTKDDFKLLKDDILDEVDEKFKEQNDRFDKKLEKQTKVILQSIAEVVQDGINPLIMCSARIYV